MVTTTSIMINSIHKYTLGVAPRLVHCETCYVQTAERLQLESLVLPKIPFIIKVADIHGFVILNLDTMVSRQEAASVTNIIELRMNAR